MSYTQYLTNEQRRQNKLALNRDFLKSRTGKLNEIAQGFGYSTWRKLETALINNSITLQVKKND